MNDDEPGTTTHPFAPEELDKGLALLAELVTWLSARSFSEPALREYLSARGLTRRQDLQVTVLYAEGGYAFHDWGIVGRPGQPSMTDRMLDSLCHQASPGEPRTSRWDDVATNQPGEEARSRKNIAFFQRLPAQRLIVLVELHRWDRSPPRTRILFLAANPQETSRLDLEEELRTLDAELRTVCFRDEIKLVSAHAVRPDDLLRSMRSERPTVVHFSGHGSPEGIVLRSENGGTVVSGEALARLFRARGVSLVVLNSCFSLEQAAAIAKTVPAVIGTTGMVYDEAARRFSVAFYRTLGDGYSIRDAFRDGGDAVELHGQRDVHRAAGNLDLFLCGPRRE